MIRLRIFAFWVATLIVAATSISMNAQTATTEATPSVTSKTATMSVSIAVPIEHIPMGQKPWVSLTVTNLSSQEVVYPYDRIYVEGPHGEPATTLVQRSITNRLKPGESQLPISGFEPSIAPGSPLTMKYDLSGYYEFKEPGKYTVHIDVFDALAHSFVRSPVATFEVLAPTK